MPPALCACWRNHSCYSRQRCTAIAFCCAIIVQALNIRGGIGLESAHVLRAFECAWIGTILLAHAAFQLLDRLVLVFFHPFAHLTFDDANVFDAATQED